MTNTTTLSDPLTCVQTLYNAVNNNDVDTISNLLSETIVWNLSDGNNLSPTTTYNGRDAVLGGYMSLIPESFTSYVIQPSRFIADGNTVCVIGNYNAVGKVNNLQITPRFCHILTVEDGVIVRFEQIADTALINQCIGNVLN